jgi:RNA:NAD 2'-phosphotransferase (TPT1/KptA family)
MQAVQDEELLRPILDPYQFDEVVHGTYLNVVDPIMQNGLCKMARNHIRKLKTVVNNIDMAIGMPGKKGVISGMRGSCEVVVEINIVKAIKEGHIPFFISENQVILSPGVGEKGFLPSKYFR